MAYEVMRGNIRGKSTLDDFLKKNEDRYGRTQHTWVMDRGIPTEEVLAKIREAAQPVHYLVGTPKRRLGKLEKAFVEHPWETIHNAVQAGLSVHARELAWTTVPEFFTC